jgi:hypothetical protein
MAVSLNWLPCLRRVLMSCIDGEPSYREFDRTIESNKGPVRLQWLATEIVVRSLKILDRKPKDSLEPEGAA